MLTSEYDYHLPKELIAQAPAERRDQSRLMVLHRQTRQIEHKQFPDLLNYLQPKDILVVNNSKVIPARIYGTNEISNGAVEILLVKRLSKRRWWAMTHPGKRTRIGSKLSFGEGLLHAEIVPSSQQEYREIEFHYSGTWESIISELGVMPVPPYIKRSPDMTELLELDKSRYQTVYAKEDGSIAAPTAGLHFTEGLLEKIKFKGVEIAQVTLHVGTGTFLPVKTDKIEDHPMHSEEYSISKKTVDQIHSVKQKGGRIIAVGTTACRVLESSFDSNGRLQSVSGETRLFIYPGYKYKIVDCLITNFHLPKSTLMMLVSALAGKDFIFQAYEEAVRHKYRFYSYGDAMFIL